MKKARIRYINTEEREGYIVELMTEEGWDFSKFFPLVRRENAREEEEKNFVHFSLLNEIRELNEYGYKVLFK
jgi:hypothetical protein